MQARLRHLAKRTLPPRLQKWIRRALSAVSTADRPTSLEEEVVFWRNYLLTQGSHWPADYRNRLDPEYPLQEYVANVLDGIDGDHVRILDVGAGPLTKLGKSHPTKTFTITPVDILAPEYDRLLDELGLTPLVRTEYADAENLCARFGEDTFDVVHAVNSLDHTDSPLEAVRAMLSVARPGGSVILLHYENEGEFQGYNQLHQWDCACENGDFVIRDRRGVASNITRALAEMARTICIRLPDDEKSEILVKIHKLH